MERKETIKIVLDAIQSKKDLLENELDKYSLDKLQKEFDKDLNEITVDDIKALSSDKLSKIVELIEFNNNDFDFSTDEGYLSFFENLKEYIKLQNNRINKFKDSLEECNKYYEFLEEIQ